VVVVFQITPWRLDAWLILLAAVYWQGPCHWSAGVACGALLLLLNKFGVIYSAAYLQLLVTLFVLQRIDNPDGVSLLQDARDWPRRCASSLAILPICAAVGQAIFYSGDFGNYALNYRSVGIGFIRIAPTSFYWHFPPVVAVSGLLLVRLRNHLPPRYLAAGFLLGYLAIGNSLWFFGRSHEHAILCLSIVLIFEVFLCLDLVSRYLAEDDRLGPLAGQRARNTALGLAAAAIAAIAIYYGDNIWRKVEIQGDNLSEGRFIYPGAPDRPDGKRQAEEIPAATAHPQLVDRQDIARQLEAIRTVTRNSPHVYFIGRLDFWYYYLGGYCPVGFVVVLKNCCFH
jgi:hypothetical protein